MHAAAHQEANQHHQHAQQAHMHAHPFMQQQQDPFTNFGDLFANMDSIFGGNPFGDLNGSMRGMRMGGMGGPVIFFNNMPRAQRPPSPGLDANLINSLPSKPKDVECDCFVCLEKVSDEVENVYLPCKHAFCKKCIEPWFKDHDACPACRAKVRTGLQEQAQAQQQSASEQTHQSESN